MGSFNLKCDHSNHNNHHSHHHHHDHNHSHNEHKSHQSYKRKKFLGLCICSDIMRLSLMLAMILSFFLVELIVGYVTRSITLTNDSFHMLSDAMGLLIALIVAIISQKFNSTDKKRIEVLGSLINSVFLIALCFKIFIEAIERLFDPKEIKDIDLLLYVGITGLIINLAGLFLFGHGHGHTHTHTHSHSHTKSPILNENEDEDFNYLDEIKINDDSVVKSDFVLSVKDERTATDTLLDKSSITINSSDSIVNKKQNKCQILSSQTNMNMRAAFLHVLADALGSVVVIVSALINKYQYELHVPAKLIDLIDPLLCLFLVILVLSSALPLAKESSLILVKTVPNETCSSTCTKKVNYLTPNAYAYAYTRKKSDENSIEMGI